ncbi:MULTISPECIES: hypothetical protein [unclassified Streptomyces]|uniref:hypothetical protein n=1 Tax=unclassified Streptomyces TaxID=2593676 RepID=UPI002285ECD5|nr:hypothetical protein [Streptomyces sp. Je 1-369]WAL99734.1 hypothetical protein NOO62_37840 [Streptomyces sp. Je 1-369]
MDAREAAAAVRAAGVADGYYWIDGVHEPAPTPPDFVYLRRVEGGEWEVGTYERGTHQPLARYGDEDAACAHLLRQLT